MQKNNSKIILFVLNNAHRTGSTIYAEKIISYVIEHRASYNVVVHCARGGDLLDDFRALGIPVLCSIQKSTPGSGAMNIVQRLLYYATFIKIMLTVRPALVYSNTISNFSQVIIAKILKAKTLVHSHEGKSISQRMRYRILLSSFFSDQYIAVSHYAATVLNSIVNRSITVIQNGIDSKSFAYIGAEFSKMKVIGMIGTIDRNKGQLIALKALNILVNRKKMNLSIKIIGMVVDDGYYEEVTHYIHSNNLSKYVNFIGPQVGADKIYADLDCVVSASLDEAFPLVSLESMACGLPIIASSTGGNAELINDGITGFLFPVGNYEVLAEKICNLYDNEKLYLQIVKSAKNAVAANFNLDAKLDLILSRIDIVLNER